MISWYGNQIQEKGCLSRTSSTSAFWAKWSPLIWNPCLHPKVSFFAWRLLHGKNPSQDRAQACGFSLASRCCLCKSEQETTTHLLFYCEFASSIWNQIVQASEVSLVGPLSPSKLWYALSNNSDSFACKGAASIFFSTSFAIWICRNYDYLHRNSRVSQTKVTSYLSELLLASLKIEKPFSGRPLQAFCNFLSSLS